MTLKTFSEITNPTVARPSPELDLAALFCGISDLPGGSRTHPLPVGPVVAVPVQRPPVGRNASRLIDPPTKDDDFHTLSDRILRRHGFLKPEVTHPF